VTKLFTPQCFVRKLLAQIGNSLVGGCTRLVHVRFHAPYSINPLFQRQGGCLESAGRSGGGGGARIRLGSDGGIQLVAMLLLHSALRGKLLLQRFALLVE